MKRVIGIAILLGGVVSAAHAQTPRRPEAVARARVEERARAELVPRGFSGVEGIMRQRERLALTEAQLAQLEAIRKEEVARRQERSRVSIDIESRVSAGQYNREEARQQMEARLEEMRTQSEQLRSRIEQILTEEQKQILRQPRSVVRGVLAPAAPREPGVRRSVSPIRPAPARAPAAPRMRRFRGVM